MAGRTPSSAGAVRDPEDVKSVGMDILRHRVIPTYEARPGIGSEQIVQRIFDKIEVP